MTYAGQNFLELAFQSTSSRQQVSDIWNQSCQLPVFFKLPVRLKIVCCSFERYVYFKAKWPIRLVLPLITTQLFNLITLSNNKLVAFKYFGQVNLQLSFGVKQVHGNQISTVKW